MQKQLIITSLFLIFCLSLQAQHEDLLVPPPTIKPEEYIKKYKYLAVQEMHRTGIPASIILAQAMLGSGFGNSKLAKEANNHFGLTTTGSKWKGASIYHSGLKFCKYKTIAESYKNHSDFLVRIPRYDFLFLLGKTEYEAWAMGLDQANYAIAEDYGEHLIDLIKRYDLAQYDYE